MNNTLKKTLSIILAILMVATFVPFAFAAESDEHIHKNSNGIQTCMGYKCDICKKYFGEAGEHGRSIQTCIGKICLTCRTPYGEKDVNAHYWGWGYCNYCSKKLPDDFECSHEHSGDGFCGYCAYIDENSDKLLIDVWMETGVLDAFSHRMFFYEIVYGASKVDEVYKSINEEYANLRKTRGDRFLALAFNGATVGGRKADIEALWAEDHKLADMLKNCLDGVHNVDEYTSNGDATCIANGTKTGDCTFCTAKNITVEDEGTMLPHANDNGDEYCDGCGVQILCEDCGRPVHEGFIQDIICWFVMLINLVKSMF